MHHDFVRLLSRSGSRALAALLPLALCSCATVDSRSYLTSAVDVPAHWQSTPPDTSGDGNAQPLDTAALANWWSRFNDPVLDQLIDEALKSSPDIRTALSKIEAARAQRGIQNAGLFPSVSAGVSGSGSRNKNRETDVTSRSENYNAGLDASWQVDLFGQQRAALDAASADLAQTEENYHAARVSLAAEVASTYVSLRAAEAQLGVVQRSLQTRSETLEITRWREQAGVSSALETQQTLSDYEQARASLPSAQQTISQTRNQLALLTGKTPGALDALLSTNANVPAAPAQIAIGIPAETLAQRPDVRAAARAVEAAAARTRGAERARLPSLDLSGSIGVEALTAGKLFSPSSTIASVVGRLTAPIFEAGRIQQTIEFQNQQEKQALIGYESTVLSALAEVENALVAEERTSERLAVLDSAVKAAREAATLAQQQYEAGSVDLLTVLDAQRTLLSVEQQQVSTTADQTSAHIQLYKALGGGWASQES